MRARPVTAIASWKHLNLADSVVTLTYKLYSATGEADRGIARSRSSIFTAVITASFPRSRPPWRRRSPAIPARSRSSPRMRSANTTRSWCASRAQDRFPDDVKIGMQFEERRGRRRRQHEVRVFTVTDIADGKVVVDGNHPLAGQRLRFDCTDRSTCGRRRPRSSRTGTCTARAGIITDGHSERAARGARAGR